MPTYEQIKQHNYITMFTYEQMCFVIIHGGHPGLNQGHVDLQSNALPLSNIPSEYGNK